MNKALLLCCVKIKEWKSKLSMIYILLNSVTELVDIYRDGSNGQQSIYPQLLKLLQHLYNPLPL